jgi:hypothetical protein
MREENNFMVMMISAGVGRGVVNSEKFEVKRYLFRNYEWSPCRKRLPKKIFTRQIRNFNNDHR